MNREIRIDSAETPDAVTVDEVKAWSKIPGTTEDATFIPAMIKACRQLVEEWTGRSYVEKTLTVNWNVIEDYTIELPMGPVRSITSIKRVYSDGTLSDALVEGTDYFISGMDFQTVNLYTRWSSRSGKLVTGLRAEYKVGHSVDGAGSTIQLPEPLKQALLRQIATDYDMRDDLEQYIPVLYDWVKEAIQPYKIANLWL